MKISGLKVNNPKGLMDTREGEEVGENEIQQYREAVRRGCKRLAYNTRTKEVLQDEVTGEEPGVEEDGGKPETSTEAEVDAMEEEAKPRSKIRRNQRPLGGRVGDNQP